MNFLSCGAACRMLWFALREIQLLCGCDSLLCRSSCKCHRAIIGPFRTESTDFASPREERASIHCAPALLAPSRHHSALGIHLNLNGAEVLVRLSPELRLMVDVLCQLSLDCRQWANGKHGTLAVNWMSRGQQERVTRTHPFPAHT